MKKILRSGIVLILGVVFILPVALTFLNSLSFENTTFTLKQYVELLTTNYTYLYFFWNSVLYSVVITFFNIVVSFPLGYLFAQVKFKGRDAVFFIYIVVMMLPFQATLLPNYIQLRDFELLQTRYAIIVPLIFSPFAVFLFRQFMKSIPAELIDYTMLETSSVFKLFKYVVLPHVKTAVTALAILVFCECWNIVEPALIFISELKEAMPLSVILAEIPENVSFSGSVVYMFPILVLFLLFKEALQSSMENYKW